MGGQNNQGFGQNNQGFGQNSQGFGQNNQGFGQNNQGFNNQGSGQNNQGFGNNNNQVFSRRCQCSFSHSKKDRRGFEEAKCARPDNTGKKWCYTTSDSQCSDAKQSRKYVNNPWSYEACTSSSRLSDSSSRSG